jgi:hypothetical protein
LQSEDIERIPEGENVYTARPTISYNGESYVIVSMGRDFLRPVGAPPQNAPGLLESIWLWLPTSGPRLWIF